MGSIVTSSAVTAKTAGAREIPVVGARTAGYFPSGARATIAVEAKAAGNFLAGARPTAVRAGDHEGFPGGVDAIDACRRASTAVRAGDAQL